MQQTWLRKGYEYVVRMHPGPFRERFGREMVWIFDEERAKGGVARLLFDAVWSLVRQHARGASEPERAVAPFGLLETGSGMPRRRYLEAAMMASLLVTGAMLLLGQLGRPYPVAPCRSGPPPRLRRTLTTPAGLQRGMVVANGPARVADANQVNDQVASAVRIVRAQERNGFATAGYCEERPSR